MTRVRHDYVPAEMTPGERAAILLADENGWINPPLIRAWKPEPPRPWRSVHLRYLERRGLIGGHRYRIDGAFSVRLNRAGLALQEQFVREWAEAA